MLLLGGRKVAAEKLGVDPKHTPPWHVEAPPVGAEMAHVALAATGIDRRLTTGRRLLGVAEIVVAGQEAQRQAKRIVQPSAGGKIGLLRGAIQADVAAVQDQIGPGRTQRRTHLHEIVDKERPRLTEMGVGNLGDTKGHDATLPWRCCNSIDYTTEERGGATSSSDFRSAWTPSRSSTSAATTINAAPRK